MEYTPFIMPPAFIENPTGVKFQGQDADEQILLLLRAHPITNLKWIIPALTLFFLPFFLPAIVSALNIDFPSLPNPDILVLLVINYLLVLAITFEGFLYWYFNVYLVTDKNLVDIDFHSILFKNIDVAPLRNVEDVSSSISGILASIFNFGDVLIQTAGATKNIDFLDVPSPDRVADFILDRVHDIGGGP